MSPETVQVIIAVLALCGTMFSGYLAFKMAQLNQQQSRAAHKTEEVKQELR